MQKYMRRLVRCGFKPYDASRIYSCMIKAFDTDDLELLVSEIEKDKKCGSSTIRILSAEM